MNERIKELADKIWAEEYWDNLYADKLLPAQLNRFAELIIQECANLFDKDEIEISYVERTIHNIIKQHFGLNKVRD